MKNLAVIPARSGSKGLKHKNIKLLNNKPLLAYSIEAAINSRIFDEIMVSTDSEKYADIAKQYGARVPFLRSKELSGDCVSSWDSVREVLEEYNKLGVSFDTVTLLQPTSPLRTVNDIIAGYDLFKNKNADCVASVCEMDHSPLWSNTLPEDCSMSSFLKPEILDIPRQNNPNYYRINGALYIVKTKIIIEKENIYNEKSFALIMKCENSIDIDNELDFTIAQALLNTEIYN